MTIPSDIISLACYRRHFLARAGAGVAAYIEGFAADGFSYRDNFSAFERLKLWPRVLRDMQAATTQISLLGLDLPSPVLIAPMAYHRLVHEAGELATARAAALTGHVLTVSAQASILLEEIAGYSRKVGVADVPLWFQLYPRRNVQESCNLMQRAADSGYRAIVVTVDAPVSGLREVEHRAGFVLPAGISAVNLARYAPEDIEVKRPGSIIFQGMLDGSANWNMLKMLVDKSSLPVLVKGILHGADAVHAVEAGVAGIIVSNHGGRVLDGVPATMDVLRRVVAHVGGRVPVLLDGGVRRGSDIVKALALGANAVMIGRPVLHALAVGGVKGVVHMLTLLQTELEMTMALCGRATVDAINADVIYSERM